MILGIDVGNTNIVLGLFEGDKIVESFRVSTDIKNTTDEITIKLYELLKIRGYEFSDIDDCIISSVVPNMMFSLEKMCDKYFNVKPIIVGPGIKTGLDIKYKDPKQVGADRIVNAVAGIKMFDTDLIIVDFGTATTFCHINDKAQYMGGAICPGIKISAEALYQRTAKLVKVDFVTPKNHICKTSEESMRSGIIYGYVGLVEYMINNFKKEIGKKDIKVIATGGLANMIAKETDSIDIVKSDLTLMGLIEIYKLNRKLDEK